MLKSIHYLLTELDKCDLTKDTIILLEIHEEHTQTRKKKKERSEKGKEKE